ncbi:MAG: glycosyl transferase family 2, partial [Bacteroidota bacterium]
SKRLFDISLALAVLLSSPISIWIASSPFQFFLNTVRVLFNRRTWVGYVDGSNRTTDLPELPGGIISPAIGATQVVDTELAHKLNHLYARDYYVGGDWKLVWKYRKRLGDN